MVNQKHGRQSFSFARRNNYIKTDPMEFVDTDLLLSSCKMSVAKTDGRILTKSELHMLYKAVLEKEEEYPYYMPNYAIELSMYTGMRVGEIAALHWSDIRGAIHIDYSEHRLDFKDKRSELIISEPKNCKHRTIQLTDKTRDLFDRVKKLNQKSIDDFIFVRPDGRRYTGHDISCAASRRAIDAGIGNTSIHEIRRTISSLLNTKLPQRVVADMLGHSEYVNKHHYNFSTAEDEEMIMALNDVIQSYSNV